MTRLALKAAILAFLLSYASTVAANGPAQGPRAIALSEAVKLAVAGNLDAVISRLNISVADKDLIIAEAELDPTTGAGASAGKSRIRSSSALASPPIVESDTFRGEVSVSGKVETGADYKASFNASSGVTNSDFQSLSPSYGASIQLEMSQPLLKNAGAGVALWKIRASGIKRESVALSFRAAISDLVTNTVEAYWNLAFYKENVKAQAEAYDRAVDIVKRTEAQVKAGVLPPIEITSAKASAASWEEKAIAAQNAYENASDALLKLLGSPSGPLEWGGLILDPIDAPEETRMEADVEKAVQTAIANRPEVAATKKDVEKARTESSYYENQKLPELGLTASVVSSGTRGDARATPSLTGDRAVSPLGGSAWDAVGDAGSLNYYDYSVGLKFSYPWGSRAANARAAQAGLAVQTAEVRLKIAERDAALEAREAGRTLVNSLKRVEAARAASRLGEERLYGELKKFDAGVTTLFATLEYHKDLAAQKATELSALADARKASARLSRAMGLVLEKNGVELDLRTDR
jgi:HAE1 family hydrophobic/amphiphilic exporter-1